MKLGKFILGAFFALVISSQAATVIASSAPALDGRSQTGDFFVINQGGTLVSSGFVGTGRFTLSDADVAILATAGNLAALAGAFSSDIGTDNFVAGADNQLGFSVPGFYFVNNNNFDPTSYIGSTVYTLIGNGATFASSTQFALIRHPEAIIADPASPALPLQYVLDAATGNILLAGSATTTTVTNPDLQLSNATVNAIRLVNVIPEPSTMLLGAFGALGLLRRRR